MISEEIALNDHLEAEGYTVVETDLGEYIIQLRKEPPSHIIAPAVHLSRDQVEADFRRVHTELPQDRNLTEPESLVAEARAMLRQKYLDSDVGITGANFLIAETGSSVIVTNEGNGDLTQSLPKVHIVIASLEKVVPTLEEFQDMLRCIRCGACMNHCPVYHSVGGHAYGWVYPGPMGSVLTPSLIGVEEAGHLPNASTFCGRCESVCPMRIPLPKMMRHWREREFEKHLSPGSVRWGLSLWRFFATRPRLYQAVTGTAARAMALLAGTKGRLSRLPLAGGWTRHREFPAPQGKTFQALWAEEQKKRNAA